jgi:hypothetical protein
MNYLIESNLTRVIAIVIIGFVISALTAGIYFVLKRWFKMSFHKFELFINKYFYMFKIIIRKKYRRMLIAIRIIKLMPNDYTSPSIELVFNFFIDFYEANSQDIKDNWQLPENFFPEGIKDLQNTYKWILKTRIDNYEEFSMIDFDYSKNKFSYWGSEYQGLFYKIKNGRLEIDPQSITEYAHPENVFNKKYLQLKNDLYNLDSEKCNWILERRKFMKI